MKSQFYRSVWALCAMFVVSSCVYEGASDILCESGQTSPGRVCVDGYWVSDALDMTTPDASDGGNNTNNLQDMPDMIAVDMETDMPDMVACVAETDPEFCARLDKNCGTVTDIDNCGDDRQAACGTCVAPSVCGADNVCACEAETDEEFCTRLGKDCDLVTDSDNCGAQRTVSCGTCAGNEVCGEQSPNVCGCPCLIGGTCYPDGAPNPGNQCEICSPTVNANDWTVNTGATCDDNDFCTVSDTCTAAGACEGPPKDCSSLDTDCRDGVCDPANGNCVPQFLPNNTACTDEGLGCTSDVCQNGTCDHSTIINGNCLISGTCYTGGANNPANECEACRPGSSQTVFTDKSNGTTCTDDGVTCTVDQCISGVCNHATIQSGTCRIGGTCYTNTQTNPGNECEQCNPAASQTVFTDKTNGTACSADSFSCTVDQCVSGVCDHAEISAGNCFVGNVCYTNGTSNPSNECEQCTAATSQSAFTDKTNGTACSADGLSCTVDQCISGTCNHATLNSSTCLIAGTCYSEGGNNPANECEACISATSTTAFTDKANGTACSGDALTCTVDQCIAGTCNHATLLGNTCLVSGTCYTEGADDPTNECRECASGTSTTAFTNKMNGTACSDDGLACTTDVCSTGSCAHNPPAAGACLISGACYTPGEQNPSNPCEDCDPGVSTVTWSDDDGETCDDGLGCTGDGTCAGGACANGTVTTGCLIMDACYVDNDVNPSDSCQICDSGSNSTDWTTATDGTVCDTGCTCQSGSCVDGTMTVCP